MKLTSNIGDILTFRGDALIVHCDCDLTYKKTGVVSAVFKKGGENLIKELTVIGYCGIGNCVITQGYDLSVKNAIFMPVREQSQNSEIDFVTLHRALRGAFVLASLYSARTVAIQLFNLRAKPSGPRRLLGVFSGQEEEKYPQSNNEVLNTIKAVSKDFSGSLISEVVVYCNPKPANVGFLRI